MPRWRAPAPSGRPSPTSLGRPDSESGRWPPQPWCARAPSPARAAHHRHAVAAATARAWRRWREPARHPGRRPRGHALEAWRRRRSARSRRPCPARRSSGRRRRSARRSSWRRERPPRRAFRRRRRPRRRPPRNGRADEVAWRDEAPPRPRPFRDVRLQPELQLAGRGRHLPALRRALRERAGGRARRSPPEGPAVKVARWRPERSAESWRRNGRARSCTWTAR